MTTETPLVDNLVRPGPAEEHDLVELDRELKEILSKGLHTAKLVSADGHEVEVPASAFEALRLVAEAMAHGQPVMLVPQGQELTTQQAADLLHVSRPHVIKLLEEGEMPFHKVGTHRRIRIEDVLAHRGRRNARRREELRRLTELAEEAPGGYH